MPFPPLAEQRRIAAILDAADALRRKRKRAIDLLDSLAQSIFHEMFGDPFVGNRGGLLKEALFEELTTRITYGFTQPMSHHDSGIPILTAKNVRNGFLDFSNAAYANQDEFDSLTEKSKPKRNDILITKDGAIGRSACVQTDDQICINQSVALIKPRLDLVDPIYLLNYLLSASVQSRIDGMKKGNAIPHLQITELAKFPIFLPPMPSQRQFVEQIARIDIARNRMIEAGKSGEGLLSSLVHRAFSGRL